MESLLTGIGMLLVVFYGLCHMLGAQARRAYWRSLRWCAVALLRLPFLAVRGLANAILRGIR